MTSEPQRLGPLESQVLDVLWQAGPCTIRQIINHLERDLAYTTIATVLGNLERKELVAPLRGQGKSVSYRAVVGREEHAATVMSHALETGGDRAASMRFFVQSMSAEEIELLREFLDSPQPGADA